MGYAFNKHLTIEANIAVAHGVAVFEAHAAGKIGAPNRIQCKTRGRYGSVEAVLLTSGKYLVQSACGRVRSYHPGPVDAMQHMVALVGPKNAMHAVEKAALGRSDGGTNFHTIEAHLQASETVRFSKTFLKSSARPRGGWCFAVRLGIGQSPDGIKRANDDCAYGGCCIYQSYAEGLEGFNRATARAS